MRIVSLISGGIDSPVATYLAQRKGYEVIAVHMDNRPFADDNCHRKAVRIVKRLDNVTNYKTKMYIVPFGDCQKEFAINCKKNMQCVLCKRMMLRISEKIAEHENSNAILTGDSLGQVASQTLQNIRTEESAIQMPVIRPLIGFDKVEIIEIAKKIGTFELSTLPMVCCNIVPLRPITYSYSSIITDEEKKIDIGRLVQASLNDMTLIN